MHDRHPKPRTVLLDSDDELLAVDSGMICVVDQFYVDEFLEAIRDELQGSIPARPGDFGLATGGILCDTGGDGQFALAVEVDERAVFGFEIAFDPSEGFGPVRQTETFAAPSGTIVIADPANLFQFVPDPFVAPAQSWGCWAALSLPGPGVMTVHSIASASLDTSYAGIRGTWSRE